MNHEGAFGTVWREGAKPGRARYEDDVCAWALERAYQLGRRAVLRETTLPEAALPGTLPYRWDEVMQREIAWPEG